MATQKKIEKMRISKSQQFLFSTDNSRRWGVAKWFTNVGDKPTSRHQHHGDMNSFKSIIPLRFQENRMLGRFRYFSNTPIIGQVKLLRSFSKIWDPNKTQIHQLWNYQMKLIILGNHDINSLQSWRSNRIVSWGTRESKFGDRSRVQSGWF